MSRLAAILLVPALALLGAAELRLATAYEPGRRLRLEVQTELELETTAFEALRDGEPIEGFGGGFGGGGSVEQRLVVMIDQVLESEAGAPTRVRREFETVEGSRESGGRGERRHECPLDGVTLELSLEDGEVIAEVVDGAEPEDESVLEGHRLVLAADALLAEHPVELEGSWELDDDQVRRLLGLDLDRALFQRAERGGGGRFGDEGGERRRGPGGRGAGAFSIMRGAEWSATATLVDAAEEHQGETCARVEFLLESEGELPEPELRVGRGRMLGSAVAAENESSFEVELEGFLLFSLDSQRPVLMEVEGAIGTASHFVRGGGETSFEIRREQVGSYALRVEITREEDA